MRPIHRSLRLSACVVSSFLVGFPPVARAVEEIAVKLPARVPADDRPRFAADEALIRFRSDLAPGLDLVRDTERALGATLIRSNTVLGIHRFRLPAGTTVADAIRRMRSSPHVEFVEPNWIYTLDVAPNDPFYASFNGAPADLQKWVYDGIGADRNLNAEAAWDLTTGRGDVIIAVIDTGIDLDHPDLAANIWTNPGEIPGNGVDDDGNGFIDDLHGWDFRNNDADANPDLGDGINNDGISGPDSNVYHGTFSASCACAVTGNGAGLAGAAWGCRLMSLKIFTDDGGAFVSDIADAITYAGQHRVAVANMSFGGGFSASVTTAVNFAWSRGVVLVASAGNSNSSSSQSPAALAHVISVGASDSGSVFAGGSGDIDGRASFSQFGTSAVDVVAPGVFLVGAGVQSVADGSPGTPTYFIASGTSFSSPIVAGLAALVISRAADAGVPLTNDGVASIIQTTAIDLPDDPGDSPDAGAGWDHFGRVDFLAAVNAVTGTPTNHPPVANAGPDRAGLAGQVIAFDATGSTDPDLDPLAFTWDFGDGSPAATGTVVSYAYATAGAFTVTLTASDGTTSSTDTASVTITAPVGPLAYFSFKTTTTLPGIGSVANEDIVAFDTGAGSYTLRFDGSDVGLTGTTLDGFCLLPDGDILMTFASVVSIPGLIAGPGGGSTVDDSDVVTFTPSSLGPTTSGFFTFTFDGSDVGLTTDSEDVDALAVDSAGSLILSIANTGAVTGLTGVQDEDLIRFSATSLGATTAGTFSFYFDGSDVGLASSASEDVDAAFVGADGRIYLSTVGSFGVPGASGSNEDVLLFTPTSIGPTTSGTFVRFLQGTSIGIPSTGDVSGFFLAE